jgi:hypothetical protein
VEFKGVKTQAGGPFGFAIPNMGKKTQQSRGYWSTREWVYPRGCESSHRREQRFAWVLFSAQLKGKGLLSDHAKE